MFISSSAGGFDIREILSWNKCLMLKHFWKLLSSQSSIWTVWATAYLVKGADIWTIVPLASSSPLWKKILFTRDHFIQQVGGVRQAQRFFYASTTHHKLHMKKCYQHFRKQQFTLYWTKALQDSVVIPRHRFITVLAMQHGLSTIDNICKRGYCIPNRCALCLKACESQLHLFFQCEFSGQVLQAILTWQGITHAPLILNHELRRLSKLTGRGRRKKWARCALAAVVYSLWQERNARIFTDTHATLEQLLHKIKTLVRIRLLSNLNSVNSEEIILALES
ncbi:uncharacterized protein LOC141601427 [Silene latifolia]|uniref:uncharacterized protein LOC141601427 n=1 Tax=Silene latifolia TaxID=37657 RepID=UPI003D771C49